MSSYGNLYVKDLNVSGDIDVDTIKVDDKIEIETGTLLTNNATVFTLLKASSTLEVDSLLYFGNEVASQIVGNSTNKTVGTNLNLTDPSNEFPAKYDNYESQITQLQTDVSGNSADIAQNVSDISGNSAAIAQNVSDISGNSAAIAQNVLDISGNAADILTRQGQISTIQSQISTIQTDISGLDTRVTTLEGYHAV